MSDTQTIKSNGRVTVPSRSIGFSGNVESGGVLSEFASCVSESCPLSQAGTAITTAPTEAMSRILGVVGVPIGAMRLPSLVAVVRGVFGLRHGVKMRRVAAAPHRTTALRRMVKMPTRRNRADRQLVGEPVRKVAPTVDARLAVPILANVSGIGPAGVGAFTLIDSRPKGGNAVLLRFLPPGGAAARTEATHPDLHAIRSWRKRCAALFAGTGILGGHLRDSFGDVAPPAVDKTARGFYLPELYPIQARN